MVVSDLTTTTVLNSIIQEAPSIIPSGSVHQNHHSTGGWSSPDSLLTKLFSGDPSTIAFAFIITLSLPVLLHVYFYTQSARSRSSGGTSDGIPTFALIGPSGGGKTSLVTLLQRRMVATEQAAQSTAGIGERDDEKPRIVVNGNGKGNLQISPSVTRLTQVATTTGMKLRPGIPLGSNKYRSENDYEVVASKKEGAKYKIIDTPGHGKLRLEQSLSWLTKPNLTLSGVVFVVDSSAMDTGAADGGEIAKDTVGYLHDVLLELQRRPRLLKKQKAKAEDLRLLVACNKQDLFTSLPPTAIKSRLETELERAKASKKKGVSAVDAKDDDADEDETVLGGGGEEKFSFKLLEEEFGVTVEVVGGTVKGDGDDGNGVRRWEEWIGGCL